MKQLSYSVQLPIVRVSRESYISTSLAKARIPHLINRGIPLGRQGKQLGKSLGQRLITAPLISPEIDLGPLSHLELYIIPTPIRLLQDFLPNPTPNVSRASLVLQPKPS